MGANSPAKEPQGLTFGQTVRAYRLGWHALPWPQRGLLRISPACGGVYCELHPLGLVPPGSAPAGEYHCWWEEDGGRQIIEESPYLRAIIRVKARFALLLGDDGMPVAKGGAK